MTTEELIAGLERLSDDARDSALEWCGGQDGEDANWFQAWATLAQIYELRALRLMLQEEIREAVGALRGPEIEELLARHKARTGRLAFEDEPVASRKAPCLYPLPDGRRCCECATCQPVRHGGI